ncbi:hypothetical protein EXN66_Car022272 [Channa argus]|uniref:Uncharacterized protein n=1 Tax=Channa argus TaxID=215402 RepID=A0A6G1QV56_CHAAH|nr:hypothetical protein EXN66_Car022272 [Channa argus]KAK2879684.1 hypothetical protein Q8A73_023496 [Channa argus]
MIPMGHSLCLPSPDTVQELFSVARDASIIPDISLDPVLTTFLSLDSSAALQHHFAFLQRGMSVEQQTKFSVNLTEELGGSSRVMYGGVGVVALALSMLFDQVAQQVRAQGSKDRDPSSQRSQANKIFGISTSSRIGWIINSYLCLVPGIANNQETMAETTELYDRWLKLELLDHYERMTTKKRMSSESMQQWLAGAAIHLHMRIHQVRLHSVPPGSVESLRLFYKTALRHLVRAYTSYLRKNIQETEVPGPEKPSTGSGSGLRQTNTSSITDITCLSKHFFNVSLVSPNSLANETAAPNSSAEISRNCKDVVNNKTLNISTGYSMEANKLGLLVIEPWKNVSHHVQHHPCESPAIQQALVTRIINAQDLERNRNFFLYPEKVFRSLIRQRNYFEFQTH